MRIKHFNTSSLIMPLMVLIALLPMLSMAYIAYSLANNSLTNQINTNLVVLEKRKIENIDEYIRERKLDSFQLASSPIIYNYIHNSPAVTPTTAMDKYIDRFNIASGFDGLILAKVDGKIVYSSESPQEVGQNVNDIPEYSQPFNVASVLMMPYVAYSFEHRPTSARQLFIAAPVFDSLQFKLVGVLILSLDKDKLSQVINTNVLEANAANFAGLVSQEKLKLFSGNTMHAFYKPDSPDEQSLWPLLNKAAQGEQSLQEMTLPSGKTVVAVYRYLPELSMGLLTQYDSSVVYSKVIWFKHKIMELILLSLGVVASLTLYISQRLKSAAQATEKALLNVLPQKVINEIKAQGHYQARVLNQVSVIFIDIVNYSQFALQEDPEKLTQTLSEIYTKFDILSDKFQINKIKTIGDAYMAMADLADGSQNAANAVDFATACIEAIQEYNQEAGTHFSIRVGINTGDVMAGVISAKKISYDIWGNNVNIAARFEKASLTNHVLLSQSTYDLLPNKQGYALTPENAVPCKGIGDIDAYSLDPKS